MRKSIISAIAHPRQENANLIACFSRLTMKRMKSTAEAIGKRRKKMPPISANREITPIKQQKRKYNIGL